MILAHKRVMGISFTGSTPAGRAIAAIAGKYGKKCVMELGGSDPFVVLKDADLNHATDLAVASRLQNCGQVCFSGKRFIVEEPVYEPFKKLLVEKVKKYKIGNPMNKDTQLGPMARPDLLDNIDSQLKKSVQQGGTLIHGGGRPAGDLANGNFYNPAVVEVSDDKNVLATEETFGPVFCLIKAKDAEDCVTKANNTEFGLGAVICSTNVDRAEQIATQIESGMVFINEVVKSDSRLPSGGIKSSGYGRECGDYGIKEFANARTIWVGTQF
jgi:succinate-semialdehyde dehydrogenase/glutarate-semialdehyde dehydrogenase